MKAPHIDGRLERQASDVAARSRKTCDKAAANRVVCHGEHDRDLLCREECGSRRDNDIPFQLDELATLAPLRQALSYGRLSCGGLVFGFFLKACTFRLLPHRKPIFVNQLEGREEGSESANRHYDLISPIVCVQGPEPAETRRAGPPAMLDTY